MANLYTYMITTMKQSRDMVKHHKNVVKTLDSIHKDIEMLLEDPLFIDGIHGEQELSIDQSLELLKAIKDQFKPLNPEPEEQPLHEAGVSDVSWRSPIAHHQMSTPSEFKRSDEYRDRTRSNYGNQEYGNYGSKQVRNFDYQTQQVVESLERQ